jgi:hypothetical protein
MVDIAMAARNMLLQAPKIKQLVADNLIGNSTEYPLGWIFHKVPRVHIEKKNHTSLIIVTRGDEWTDPNSHNTALFPTLYVDVWADPTRNPDGSLKRDDADEVIDAVGAAVAHYMHTPNQDVPSMTFDPEAAFQGLPGMPRYWGTASQIADKTGVPIISSLARTRMPEYFDVEGGDGARMGRFIYNIETA